MDAKQHSELMEKLETDTEFVAWFRKGISAFNKNSDIDWTFERYLAFGTGAGIAVPQSWYAAFKSGWIVARQIAEGTL